MARCFYPQKGIMLSIKRYLEFKKFKGQIKKLSSTQSFDESSRILDMIVGSITPKTDALELSSSESISKTSWTDLFPNNTLHSLIHLQNLPLSIRNAMFQTYLIFITMPLIMKDSPVYLKSIQSSQAALFLERNTKKPTPRKPSDPASCCLQLALSSLSNEIPDSPLRMEIAMVVGKMLFWDGYMEDSEKVNMYALELAIKYDRWDIWCKVFQLNNVH